MSKTAKLKTANENMSFDAFVEEFYARRDREVPPLNDNK